ncbi:MAG: nicotinate-nucleotide adenylyltransferase [Dehalococcoidia bacterium]|nr:MAG: nicotinate-nucleotide adenylyltransferase [Dehalococcoidia bacterium]
MKTGILGGTFDPVHSGHLKVAVVVKDELNLDEVIFIPAGNPWLKADNIVLPVEHRLNMLRLAISGHPHFWISTLELERTGPTYSVDTLNEMRREMADEKEFYFILGWDNLAQLHCWHQPQHLISLCHLVAVPRIGYPFPNLASIEVAIPGITQRLIVLNQPYIDISASATRQMVRQGLPISHLVPKAVEKYIQDNRLYQD